ncbi:hypothetical protein [Coleofasciculus sp. FACHB-501]|nr:hypothetical protein [Coleofasciculus sp. FACHB-501]
MAIWLNLPLQEYLQGRLLSAIALTYMKKPKDAILLRKNTPF